MPIPYFTITQLLEKHPLGTPGGVFKFVRICEEYRFIEITMLWTPKHSELVADGELPQSAGMISIWPDCWEMKDTYSSTLKIGATEIDYEMMTQKLGRQEKTRW